MSENESLVESKNATNNKQPPENSAMESNGLDLDFASVDESQDKQNKQKSIVHPGLYLRKAREDRNINRSEIALKLKLNVELIKALEEGNEGVLPGSVFTSGYIRSYARLVDLSPGAMVEEYQRYIRQKKPQKVAKTARPNMPPLPGILEKIKEYLSSVAFISDSSAEAKSARYAATGVIVVIMLVTLLVIFGTPDSEPKSPQTTVSDLGPIDKTITTPIMQEKISLDTIGGDNVSGAQSNVQKKVPQVIANTGEKKQNLSPIVVQAQNTDALTAEAQSIEESGITETQNVEPQKEVAQAAQTKDIKKSNRGQQGYLVKPLEFGLADAGGAAGSAGKNNELVANVTLTVRYDAESWVDIRDATGKRLIGNVGKANTEKEITGTPPFRILIGFSPGVTLEYNGVPVDYSSQQVRSVARFTLAAVPGN